jgi:pilus assembly protein CpaC
MKKGGTAFTTGLVSALIVIMVAPVMAQVQPVAARATGAVASIEANAEEIDLLVGRSAVIRTDRPIKRVSLPTPEIADAMVTSPQELLVHGKTPGTISLLVWGDTGRISSYQVIVQRDLSALEERVRQLFPGEPIKIAGNGADVVLSGIVSSKYVVEKAAAVAAGYVEKKENVVNLLRQNEELASNQVLLRVRFAEVSRSALQELGASFFTGPTGVKNTLGRTTTQQFSAPGYDKLEWQNENFDWGSPVTAAKGEFTFSDFLNLFFFSEKYNVGTMVRALSSKGLFQSLAEPNLVTQNGKEASFLAGGEFPFPVAQGGGVNQSITIMFKEFGVRLRFTPTITSEGTIQLKVMPEVSSLDFSNAIQMNGFTVPAISTRRTETEVELRDGQTFAIAGLIDNSVNQTVQKVPGLGDIPILGLLFKSRAYQKNATELVVMITPQILRRDSVGVTDHLPRQVEPYLPYEQKTIPPPAPAFSTPEARSVAPVGDASADADAAPADRAASVPSKAELKTVERQEAEEAKRARDAEKAEAERLEREQREAAKAAKLAEEEARKQAELDRKQAELDRKAAEREAAIEREEAKKAEKLAIEEAKRQAELDRKRLDDERKQAEKAQKEEARLAKEREKLERERAKRAAEEQELAQKLEQMRLEEERKKEQERREQQQKLREEREKNNPWPRLRSRI